MPKTQRRHVTTRPNPRASGGKVYSFFARARDVAAAGGALLALSPLIALTGIYVRVKLGRPVLFRQERIGKDGSPFTIVKFRTMKPFAYDHQPDSERMSQAGSLLRTTSLDELPTLWNVLIGDMSLVGPRPLLPWYLEHCSPEQARRHKVRPGITGLAQVRGRNSLTWPERFEADVEYVDHRSFLFDTQILIRTVGVVLAREGISEEGQATMTPFAPHPETILQREDTPDAETTQ